MWGGYYHPSGWWGYWDSGFREVAQAAHICALSNMRSEMDSVSCDLKVHLTSLPLLLCLLEKLWKEEHCVEEKNYGCETYFIHKEILGKKGSNPFFYLCLRNEKSIFNYIGKVDQGLTYRKCWVQGWRLNMERGNSLLFGRKQHPYIRKRLESLFLQPALDLEVNSVKYDLSRQ